MGLFSKYIKRIQEDTFKELNNGIGLNIGDKPIWEYQLMERVPVDLDEEMRKPYDIINGCCNKIAENNNYEFYRFRAQRDNSDGFVLRRNKLISGDVVFFGKLANINLIYKEFFVQVDHYSDRERDGSYFIYFTHISTGKTVKIRCFGSGTYYQWMGDVLYCRCQDSVESVHIEKDYLVLQVHRKRCDNPDYLEKCKRENYLYNVDTNYEILLSWTNNQFRYTTYFEHN